MSLEGLKESVMALVMLALIAGALVLAVDAFQLDLGAENACVNTSAAYNTTSRICCSGVCAGVNISTTTSAFNATAESLTGAANATSYLSTIGTLIGVAALIAVVVGAFYIVRR